MPAEGQKQTRVRVIGAGLAGSEAALQLARRGFPVDLYEWRGSPGSEHPDGSIGTPAHKTTGPAELVCSNSFKGLNVSSAHGLLKEELRTLGSFLMQAAERARVPAGESLTVDRIRFSEEVQAQLSASPQIQLHREEIRSIDPEIPTIVAAGPLCSEALANDIFTRLEGKRLHFFDAIAPVVTIESIDMEHAFARNRWDKGEAPDFINCPLDKDTYYGFVSALANADAVEPKPFEPKELFEGCLPVEEMARRGKDTLRYGPMRPVGLDDPRTNRWPYAVIQLRAENRDRTLYNLVGFQTRLRWGTQKEIFRMVPALRSAEFARLGAMHRNTFLDTPSVLDPQLALPGTAVFFAGQILGAEGYTEAVATGWLAALQMTARLRGAPPVQLPADTALGALCAHLTSPNSGFQPMNFHFGMLPRQPDWRKGERKEQQIAIARDSIRKLLAFAG